MTHDQSAYIAHLEHENQYLKSLLDGAGIAYKLTRPQVEPYDPNQGARILPRKLDKEDPKRFYELFHGRGDVYSRRGINRKTGATLYYPQCENFWRAGCHRKYGDSVKASPYNAARAIGEIIFVIFWATNRRNTLCLSRFGN